MGFQTSAGRLHQHFVSVLNYFYLVLADDLPVDTNLDLVMLVSALSSGATRTTFPRISYLNCITSVPLNTRFHSTFLAQLPQSSLNTSTFCISVLRAIVLLDWTT